MTVDTFWVNEILTQCRTARVDIHLRLYFPNLKKW